MRVSSQESLRKTCVANRKVKGMGKKRYRRERCRRRRPRGKTEARCIRPGLRGPGSHSTRETVCEQMLRTACLRLELQDARPLGIQFSWQSSAHVYEQPLCSCKEACVKQLEVPVIHAGTCKEEATLRLWEALAEAVRSNRYPHHQQPHARLPHPFLAWFFSLALSTTEQLMFYLLGPFVMFTACLPYRDANARRGTRLFCLVLKPST